MAGEQIIGTCDGRGCGRTLHRGDPFITPLSGHLVCQPCWDKDDWLEAPPGIEPASEASITCGAVVDEDYGPDNPFF